MQSTDNLVRGQLTQAHAVGSPVGGAGGGDAAIVVEIYAIGAGVTLVGQSGDLPLAQVAFEFKANGKVFVIDPLSARQAYGLVSAVQGHVTTVFEPLQAVDQEQLAKVGGVDGHAQSPLRTIILSLPAGSGKSTYAHQLCSQFNCGALVDDWSTHEALIAGALHLTNQSIEVQA